MKIMPENKMYDSCESNECVEKPCYCKCVCHKGPEPGRVIIKCGCGGTSPVPVVAAAAIGTIKPIPVASVTIDPSCLKNPTTHLIFTAEINAPAAVALNLNFYIKKSSKSGCCEYICGTRSFVPAPNLDQILTFAFQTCECNTCDECVTYSIEYVPIKEVAALGASVNNPSLTAISVENLC